MTREGERAKTSSESQQVERGRTSPTEKRTWRHLGLHRIGEHETRDQSSGTCTQIRSARERERLKIDEAR